MAMARQKRSLFTKCKRALKNTKLSNMLIDSVPDLFMKSEQSGAMSMCIFYNLFLLYMYGGIISDDQFRNNFVTIELDRLGFLKHVGHVKRPNYSYDHVIHDYDRLDEIGHISFFDIDYYSPYGKSVLINYAITGYRIARDIDSSKHKNDDTDAIDDLNFNLDGDCFTLQKTPKYYTLCKLSKYGRKYIQMNHLKPIFEDLKLIYLKTARNWIYRGCKFPKSRCELLLFKIPIEKLSFVQVFTLLGGIRNVIDSWHVRRAVYNFWKNHCLKQRMILPDVENIVKSAKLNEPNPVSFPRIYQDYNIIHSRSSFLLKRDLCEGYKGVFMNYCNIGIIC